MHRPQVRIGLVHLVLAAVLGERLHLAVPVRAQLVLARTVVEIALVDVVAQAHHQVGVLAGDGAVGAEVARLPVLAREEDDLHRLARAARECGAEAADLALRGAGLEAVEVLLARLQVLAGQPRLDGVVVLAPQRERAALHHSAKVLVPGHLEPDLAVLAGTVQTGPERDAARVGAARRHSLRERAAAGEAQLVAPLAPLREHRVHRHAAEDQRARAEAGIGEQLAAVERLVEGSRSHRGPRVPVTHPARRRLRYGAVNAQNSRGCSGGASLLRLCASSASASARRSAASCEKRARPSPGRRTIAASRRRSAGGA